MNKFVKTAPPVTILVLLVVVINKINVYLVIRGDFYMKVSAGVSVQRVNNQTLIHKHALIANTDVMITRVVRDC